MDWKSIPLLYGTVWVYSTACIVHNKVLIRSFAMPPTIATHRTQCKSAASSLFLFFGSCWCCWNNKKKKNGLSIEPNAFIRGIRLDNLITNEYWILRWVCVCVLRSQIQSWAIECVAGEWDGDVLGNSSSSTCGLWSCSSATRIVMETRHTIDIILSAYTRPHLPMFVGLVLITNGAIADLIPHSRYRTADSHLMNAWA